MSPHQIRATRALLLALVVAGCRAPTAVHPVVEIAARSVAPTLGVPAVEIAVTNVTNAPVAVLRCGPMLVMTGEVRREGERLPVRRGIPCPATLSLGHVALAPHSTHADTVALAASGEWRWSATVDGATVAVPPFQVP